MSMSMRGNWQGRPVLLVWSWAVLYDPRHGQEELHKVPRRRGEWPGMFEAEVGRQVQSYVLESPPAPLKWRTIWRVLVKHRVWSPVMPPIYRRVYKTQGICATCGTVQTFDRAKKADEAVMRCRERGHVTALVDETFPDTHVTEIDGVTYSVGQLRQGLTPGHQQ